MQGPPKKKKKNKQFLHRYVNNSLTSKRGCFKRKRLPLNLDSCFSRSELVGFPTNAQYLVLSEFLWHLNLLFEEHMSRVKIDSCWVCTILYMRSRHNRVDRASFDIHPSRFNQICFENCLCFFDSLSYCPTQFTILKLDPSVVSKLLNWLETKPRGRDFTVADTHPASFK